MVGRITNDDSYHLIFFVFHETEPGTMRPFRRKVLHALVTTLHHAFR